MPIMGLPLKCALFLKLTIVSSRDALKITSNVLLKFAGLLWWATFGIEINLGTCSKLPLNVGF